MAVLEDSRTPIRPCPVCGSATSDPIIHFPRVPVLCNRLMSSDTEAALAPTGELEIVQCRGCTHVYNARFQAQLLEYDAEYENSLDYSSIFCEFVDALADRLIARYGVMDKSILEIGCGNGKFLRRICEKGGNRGFGFDPSQPNRQISGAGSSITIYGTTYEAGSTGIAADLVCCRHVLEHLEAPAALLRELSKCGAGRSGTVVYCEVPNGDFVLQPSGVWDLIYEHVSYFTPDSLEHLFRAGGYRVLDIGTSFHDQFLWIEATPDGEADAEPPRPRKGPHAAAAAREGYGARIGLWTRWTADQQGRGRRVALWGAGSKGVSFLNVADVGAAIATVVDINPAKQGRFVPVTGQMVSAPGSLGVESPDVILIMNTAYQDEIGRAVHGMGLSPELVPAF